MATFYGSVKQELTGITGTIEAGGIGNVTAFDGETFMSKWLSEGLDISYLKNYCDYYKVLCYSSGQSELFRVTLYNGSGGSHTDYKLAYLTQSQLSSWGITASSSNIGSDNISIVTHYSPSPLGEYSTIEIEKLYAGIQGSAKIITKLYGSVNGVTKRIF